MQNDKRIAVEDIGETVCYTSITSLILFTQCVLPLPAIDIMCHIQASIDASWPMGNRSAHPRSLVLRTTPSVKY